MRRARYPWLALILAPLLALISFVVVYVTNPLNYGARAPLASIPAFLLAIVVLLIGQNIASYRELEASANHSDEIYEAVKDFLHVTKVGSPEAAMKYVIARLPSLQEVRNTTLNLSMESERASDMFYDTDMYSDLPADIARAIVHGLRWKDIGDSLALHRLRHIRDAVVHTERNVRRYQYRLIGHREPQMNFIILSYPDGTGEVLFNWDFRNLGQDPTVLLSRDGDIVNMFTVQFEHLWRAASPDHD